MVKVCETKRQFEYYIADVELYIESYCLLSIPIQQQLLMTV